ncbi:MAG: ATP-binding protein [Bacteroidota bacterium]|nr:ATP-binding protein [Bacteroidota bacterium]
MTPRIGNPDLLLYASIAFGVARGLGKFLDLPRRLPRWDRLLRYIWVPAVVLFGLALVLHFRSPVLAEYYWLAVETTFGLLLLLLSYYRPARTLLMGLGPLWGYHLLSTGLLSVGSGLLKTYDDGFDTAHGFATLWLFCFFFIARSQKKQLEKEELLREEDEKARRRIEAQNVELERLVAERTANLTTQAEELRGALTELRTTQAQLVQSEKMASLGELTAGIAHEIQNPLNFVNNFAEVSAELVTELEEERARPERDAGLEDELLADLKQNLLKITQHGGRAASIVRGMLEHSRTSTGERLPTDLNQLADEYLRLAYHGLRAKDKSFNATLEPDFEPDLPLVPALAQDLGRVLLNLLNNAFYAVRQRQQRGESGYAPTVRISTRRVGEGAVEIRVADNGSGIAESVRQKIFQPFFTTKPTGEGTGLGLSLSYDIITQGHGGTLTVASREGEGTTFTIILPGPPGA